MFSRNPFSCFTAIALALFGAGFVPSANAGEIPVEAGSTGYYPTYEESDILATGDYDYLRSQAGPLPGPDLDRWAATGGIWPYEYETGGLSRVQRFFQPIDYILRPLTPGETIALQGPTSESWLQVAGAFPFLSRTYHRERSHLADLFGMENTKNIPLFIDVLNVSVTAMYVDSDGPGIDRSGLEDGFLGALGIGLRAGFAITDRTSITVAGEIYFLFGNDNDVQLYVTAGSLSALASLHFQEQIGSWDIHIFDDLIPFSARQLFMQESYQGNGSLVVGHHYIGLPEYLETSNWWNSRQHYLMNTAGITAGTFIGESWRFLAGFGRVDTWLWDDFDRHSGDEYINAGLFYDGYGSWIAPSLTYQLHTQDFDDAQHSVNLNLVAPISPNITANASAGYGWGEFYDGSNWQAGLQYQQTDRLRHWLGYANGYQDSLIGDDFIGNRFDYTINYQLGPRVTLGGYAGWFDANGTRENALHLGGSANFALGNYTALRLLVGYFDSDYAASPSTPSDGVDWYYSASLSRRLAERLNAELTYEYVDSGIGEYTEQLIMLRLTRTF